MSRLSIRPRPLDIHKKLPIVKSFKDFEDEDLPTTSATRSSQLLRMAESDIILNNSNHEVILPTVFFFVFFFLTEICLLLVYLCHGLLCVVRNPCHCYIIMEATRWTLDSICYLSDITVKWLSQRKTNFILMNVLLHTKISSVLTHSV